MIVVIIFEYLMQKLRQDRELQSLYAKDTSEEMACLKKIVLLFCALISGGPPLQREGTKNRREGGLLWDSPQAPRACGQGKVGTQTGEAAFFQHRGDYSLARVPALGL